MIYRIDLHHFLVHAIDHFSFTDLNYFEYAIISAKIKCGLKDSHCQKINNLFPLAETVIAYAETGNPDILEHDLFKLYDDLINNQHSDVFYKVFVQNVEKHINVLIVCDEQENPYIDVLCKYLKKKFAIEVIDLNKLFTKGKLDPIHYDYDVIRDKGVDVRRAAKKQAEENLATTRDGRLELVRGWDKDRKIKQCKKIGLRVRKSISERELDQILIDAWVEDGDE